MLSSWDSYACPLYGFSAASTKVRSVSHALTIAMDSEFSNFDLDRFGLDCYLNSENPTADNGFPQSIEAVRYSDPSLYHSLRSLSSNETAASVNHTSQPNSHLYSNPSYPYASQTSTNQPGLVSLDAHCTGFDTQVSHVPIVSGLDQVCSSSTLFSAHFEG